MNVERVSDSLTGTAVTLRRAAGSLIDIQAQLDWAVQVIEAADKLAAAVDDMEEMGIVIRLEEYQAVRHGP